MTDGMQFEETVVSNVRECCQGLTVVVVYNPYRGEMIQMQLHNR